MSSAIIKIINVLGANIDCVWFSELAAYLNATCPIDKPSTQNKALTILCTTQSPIKSNKQSHI